MENKMFAKLGDLWQVWWLQVGYLILSSGFFSILYFYFVKNNINFGYIILAEALGYGGSVIVMLFKRQFKVRADIQIGFILIFLGLLSLFLPFSPIIILFPYTILRLVGCIMFYVPYNILFFGSVEENKKLHKMAVYWAAASLIGILAPVAGGYLFAQLGMGKFVVVALVLLLIALVFTFFLKKEAYTYNLKEVLVYIKGTRLITMFDGALQVAAQLLIILYLLTFIQDEFSFAKILSINAFFSIVFSIKMAKFSDKSKKRIQFIWPLSVLSAGLMVSLYVVSNFWIALALIIIFKFISTLFIPICSAIVLDKLENNSTTWISREIYLNIGRFFVLFGMSVTLYYGFLKETFLLIGFLFMVFPFIIYRKRIYP